MKRLSHIPFIFLLSGCPGGPPASTPQATIINGENVCFTVNKKDVLNYYTIDSTRGNEYKVIDSKERINLSYPDTCIKVKWDYGYSYYIHYGLNGKKYVHGFFIDNSGRLTSTEY